MESAVSSSTFTSVISALTGQISVAAVVEVLATVAGITVAFAFMWWGVRYATGKIMGALKKGRA